MAGIYLVSINRSRYSAVHGGKNGFPSRAAISLAAHQRLDSLHVHCVHVLVHRPVYTVYTVYCVYGVRQCTQCVLNLVHEQTQADFSSRGNPK